MKNYFIFIIFSFFIVSLIRADTDPKTADFLKKVDGYYCCLSREGLKTIQFKVRMSIPGSVAAHLQTKYSLTQEMIQSLLKVEFTCVYKMGEDDFWVFPDHFVGSQDDPKYKEIIKSSGGQPPQFIKLDGSPAQFKAWDHIEEQWRLALHEFLTQWKCTQIWPVFRLNSSVPFSFTVQNLSDGFTVTASLAAPILKYSFDRQVKLSGYSSLINLGNSPNPPITFDFSKMEKGYLLTGILEDDPSNPQGPLRDQYQAQYGTFGNYYLPKTVHLERKTTSAVTDNFQITYTFSNYVIN